MCGHCPSGRPCTPEAAQRRAERGACTAVLADEAKVFDDEILESIAADSVLEHSTCMTCLTGVTELDGIWYHDLGDGHGLAQHLARPSKR